MSTTKIFNKRHIFGLDWRWLTHPITLFVLLQIVWVSVTVTWVMWFDSKQSQIAALKHSLNQNLPEGDSTLSTLIAGIVLLVLILLGIVGLFIWGQRQKVLMRQQKYFMSSVTHELRSPLASLKLGYETLLHRNVSEAMKNQILSMTTLDIDRLTKLIEHILVSSRFDRGIVLFKNDRSQFLVKGKIETFIHGLSYLDQGTDKRFEVSCPENLHIYFSESAFALIVINILENALKYSKPDTIIEVTVAEELSGLSIEVRDYGLGLDKREQKKIFKMFHRGDLARQRAIPGTGLGLYIVKSTIDQIGGVVTVSSDGRGLGSTFKVHLPQSKFLGTKRFESDPI